MMPEEKAKTKWCPHAFTFGRLSHGSDYSNNSFGPQNRGATMGGPLETCQCLGSACMAWRWVNDVNYDGHGKYSATSKSTGYCGLAGKP